MRKGERGRGGEREREREREKEGGREGGRERERMKVMGNWCYQSEVFQKQFYLYFQKLKEQTVYFEDGVRKIGMYKCV